MDVLMADDGLMRVETMEDGRMNMETNELLTAS
jgi:hypothetical protein